MTNDMTSAQAAARLRNLCEGDDVEPEDEAALRVLLTERADTFRALAPDLATGDRTLPQVAEAALAVARRGGKL